MTRTKDSVILVLLLLVASLGWLVGSTAALPIRQERDMLQRSLDHCRGEQRAGARLERCERGNASCVEAVRELAAVSSACRSFLQLEVK